MSVRTEILKVKEKYAERLLSVKGITGIGVNGSIIVYTERLTPKLSQFIPKTLDGVRVRVVETGKIRPLSFPIVSAIYADRTSRFRPTVPGGCSIGAPDITAGTFTGRIVIGGEVYGLSNNHILSGEWGTHPASEVGTVIYQPGVYDSGGPGDEIGSLEKWVPVKLDKPNLVDSAIFKSEILSEDILEVGKPGQTIEPRAGMVIKKSGRSSGLTYSRLIDVDATVKVEGWGEATFTDVCIAKPALGIPGDSGSWCGSENDETAAQLFAGSTEVTVLGKAVNIERLFNGEIIPPLPYLSARVMLPWGAVFALGSILSSRRWK